MPRAQYKSIWETPYVNDGGDTSKSSANNKIQDPEPAAHNETTSNNDVASVYSSRIADPDACSIFSQATITPSIANQATSDRSSRFPFLKRDKSATSAGDTQGLLHTQQQSSEKKKTLPFNNPFSTKPYEPTEKDLEIARMIRERLGSREEAIRRGGSQPANSGRFPGWGIS